MIPVYQRGRAWYVEVGEDKWSFADEQSARRFAARQAGIGDYKPGKGESIVRYSGSRQTGERDGRKLKARRRKER